MTSLGIKVFISLAAMAAVYVFARDFRRAVRRGRLVTWVRTHYPAEWNALSWTQRTLHPGAALALLHRNGAIQHPHFVAEFPKVRGWSGDMVLAFVIACVAIAATILGRVYLGWTW